MAKRLFVIVLIGIVTAGLFAVPPDKKSGKQKLVNLPLRGGSNDPEIRCLPVFPPYPPHHLDDYIGTIDTAGTTWYDYQHNGTCGRMIGVDDFDMVSLVWTNGLSAQQNPRYVYHNIWDPATSSFLYDNVGLRINTSEGCGYVTQTVGYAFSVFAFQCLGHAVVPMDFGVLGPDWCYEGETDLAIGFPKIHADIDFNFHLISTETPAVGDPGMFRRIYYSRGAPEFDPDGFPLEIYWDEMSCGDFEFWDTVTVISPDVACSRHSERCAVAWCHPMDSLQINNEIYLRVSEDGGHNWNESINITQWTPWDSDCYHSGGDPLDCDRDTFRCYTDVSVLLDEYDFIHIAFTTTGFWWYLPGESDSGFTDAAKSMIYHWNEELGLTYSLVANGWYEGYTPGAWQRNVQRPSLAEDPETGYLYCSYMQFDTTTYSESGFPMADAFVSVSTDRGYTWSVGTNVTNTTPDTVPVPSGDSMHERDVTVAPLVTDGFLHMEYILDKDAGSMVQDEGLATLNQVIYQRIPADEISTFPILPNYPMHWHGWVSAPTAHPEVPRQFVLHQNYPNPFNPTTTIQFDLTRRTNATLKIYNVLGQEVFTLLDNTPLVPGVHQVNFNGSNLPSGIYIYRLETPGFSSSRKMVLLK